MQSFNSAAALHSKSVGGGTCELPWREPDVLDGIGFSAAAVVEAFLWQTAELSSSPLGKLVKY